MNTLDIVLSPGSGSKSRAFRVFVSSTFLDMRDEREKLAKWVFPELRRRCEARGVAWGEVDLRWGISNEQRAEAQVLSICLDEIEKCHPFFVGILGERYGWDGFSWSEAELERDPWLESYPECSITELEMQRALLLASDDGGKAHFYFRDPNGLDLLSAEERPAYVECERPDEVEQFGCEEAGIRAEERRRKLAELKNRIRSSGAVVRENFRDAQSLADLVLADLTRLLDEEYPQKSVPDSDRRETALHEAFAWSLAETEVSAGVTHGAYVARSDEGARLDEHAVSTGPPLIVHGPPGIGKSALLANWTLRFRLAHPETQVVFHSVGASLPSTSALGTARRLIGELGSLCGARYEYMALSAPAAERHMTAFDAAGQSTAGIGSVPTLLHDRSSLTELGSSLQVVLGMLGSGDETSVVVLDGLDRLETRDGDLDLEWLPHRFPANVRLVLSAAPGRALGALHRRDWSTLELAELTHEERLKAARRYLQSFRKTLEPALVERIVGNPATGLPLFLRVLLEEARLAESPQVLESALENYGRASTVTELFGMVLARLEGDYERDRPDLVRDSMSLIGAARRGLSELEIRELLGTETEALPMAVWSPLRLALGSALFESEGRHAFAHSFLRDAVRGRYASDDVESRRLHATLSEYFDRRGTESRRAEELPWHLALLEDWDQLAAVLSEPAVFTALSASDDYELRSYWAEIERHTDHQMAEKASQWLDRRTELAPELLAAIEGAAWSQGNYELARRALNELIQRFEPRGENARLATLLKQSADVHMSLGHERRGFELLARARQIFEREGDLGGEAACLRLEAAHWMTQNEYERALSFAERSSAIADRFGDRQGKRVDLTNRGACLTMLGRHEEAAAVHAEEGQLARELQDWDGLARHLNNRGNLHLMNREVARAMERYLEAEELASRHGNLRSLMVALAGQVQVHAAEGRFGRAFEQSIRVRELAESFGDPNAVARALWLQSSIVVHLTPLQLEELRDGVSANPELHQAVTMALESQLELADEAPGAGRGADHIVAGHEERENMASGKSPSNVRPVQRRSGLLGTLRHALKTIGIDRHAPEEQLETLRARASGLVGRDCLQEAMELLERAEQLATNSELHEEAVLVASDVAGVLKKMGRVDEALEKIHAASVLAESLGDLRVLELALSNEAVAMWEAAVASGDRSKLNEALGLGVQSRGMAMRLDDPERLAFATGTCALIERFLGRMDDALRSFESALESARASDSADALGRALLNLAGFSLETGRVERARELLTEARTLAGRFADPSLRRQLEGLAQVLSSASNRP